MNQTLLLSKFHIPPVKPNLVTRSHLLTRLNQGLTKKIILVSAPAGFGKTTLLVDWLNQVAPPAAWLALDEDDNDFARFITYLAAAVQELDPTLDNTAVDLLQAPQPTLKNAALTALLNQIESIQAESILVLDDFHFISCPEIHQAVDYLINYLPANLHLVISSRADPPLQLSRLRGQGFLLEIRMQDLRFTKEEARQFLTREIQTALSDQTLSQLTTWTEGWISGLQMAALSLQGREDPEEYIQSFSGSNKYILDYLIEEVLKRQPPDIQEFLLYTSILERLTGDLCDQVIGRDDSQQVLEKLEKSNLFLIPLDEKRKWYRYHKLFRDLLNHRLTLDHAGLIPELQRKASHWHEQNNWMSLAIDYALAASEHNRAAALISRQAEHILMRSEVNTYQRWVSQLPPELILEDPDLIFYEAWSRMLKGADFAEVLSTAEELKQSDPKLTGRIDTLRSFIMISKGDFSRAGQTAEKALSQLPAEDSYFRGMAAYILSVFQILRQDMQDALTNMAALSQTEEYQRNPMLKVLVLSQTARVHIHLGDLSKAKELYQEALSYAKDRGGNWVPIAGEALMGLGDLMRELNELDQAADLILDGIELTQQWRKGAAMEGYLFLSRVKQLQLDWEAANQLLEKAMRLALEYDVMVMDDRLAALWQARLWSFEGKDALVEKWIKTNQIDRPVGDLHGADGINLENYLLAREKIVQIRYHLLLEEYDQSLSLTQKLTTSFEALGWSDILIEIYLLRAIILQKKGEIKSASEPLEKALRLGWEGGFIGLFLECGPDLEGLLALFEDHPELSPYVGNLIKAFQNKVPETKLRQQPLPEPLSDRELDVMGFLSSNLTTPEIAEEMVISVNTVRTHIKNIYQKLGVHKRSAAVQNAKALKLI
jgi:LuxR family maltose regulon positive regulatory protein